MDYSVVLMKFNVKEEGYKVFEKLSENNENEKYLINQMVLALKKESKLEIEDIFDSGNDTSDDVLMGGIIGGLVGIFSGPIGFLIWGSLGALIGNAKDVSDAKEDMNLLVRVGEMLNCEELGILALVAEDKNSLDFVLKDYSVEVARFDAGEIQYEVEKAKRLEDIIRKESKDIMKEERKSLRKEKLEEIRDKVADEFKNLRSIVK